MDIVCACLQLGTFTNVTKTLFIMSNGRSNPRLASICWSLAIAGIYRLCYDDKKRGESTNSRGQTLSPRSQARRSPAITAAEPADLELACTVTASNNRRCHSTTNWIKARSSILSRDRQTQTKKIKNKIRRIPQINWWRFLGKKSSYTYRGNDCFTSHCLRIKENEKGKSKNLYSSPARNRTPVSRVTGGDTHHYTTEDSTW